MKYKLLCSLALFAFAAAVTSAQTPIAMKGTCGKPDVMQTVPAGDREGHVFTLGQGKCTDDNEVNGVKSSGGVFAEHGDATATRSTAWGLYTESYAGGDKVFYEYETASTTKDGAMVSGSNKWKITGGTGKMKGMKGSGTCKLAPTADGGLTFDCSGTYTQAAAAPAKKK